MKKKFLGLVLCSFLLLLLGRTNVYALDASVQAAIDAQNQALADALAAQQAAQEALRQQALEAYAAQQAALQEMQKQATEAATAIQEASLICPQQEIICDTNCADMNAYILAKTCPDFVLVDKSEQKVIFYRNGLRVLGDSCVTGNESKGYSTTVGVHQIIFMDTNRTLKGSYGEAFVRYWMRFTNGGQGLHDAGWRNKFGETIYVSNGSHGCVNLTRPTAKTIFENAYVGMFVVVEN